MLIPPNCSANLHLRFSCFAIYRRAKAEQRMYSECGSRGYQEAIAALNSLQSNASVLATIQAAGPQPSERVFGQTTYYLRRLGYKVVRPSHVKRIIIKKSPKPTSTHPSTELAERSECLECDSYQWHQRQRVHGGLLLLATWHSQSLC